MIWNNTGNFFYLKFDPLFTVAVTSVFFIFGVSLRKKFGVLRRFSVPSGVVGGLCMAFITLALHVSTRSVVEFDQSLQIPLIALFLTRVGMMGSFKILRMGGKALIIYLVFCWGLSIFQNVLGAFMANLFGIHPVLGVMAGSVSLMGGHNLAAIFGPMAESMGVPGAQTVAVAAATYGLVTGGIWGAHTANWLVGRHKLELVASYDSMYRGYHDLKRTDEQIETNDFIHALGLLIVLMALGCAGADYLQIHISQIPGFGHFTLPSYVGAMFLAMIFRNVNDVFKLVRVHPKSMDLISTVSVSLYLTTAMMSVKIWDIYGLAMPVIAILLIQTLITVGISIILLFYVMGKDYDAAIICAGFVGHGLGATSSAVSMMRAACDHNKVDSYKAFLIVPLCSAALIDIVALPVIIWFIGHFAG